MNLLYIGAQGFPQDDKAFLDVFSRMPALVGHQVKTSFVKRENATEVAMLCKQHSIDAVFTSQQPLLEADRKSVV